MSRYKQLISNTTTFAIGNFASKLLVFLLVPIYTRVLSTSEFGTIDIINSTVSLLTPILTLSIAEGVMRFALDNETKKDQVLMVGLKFLFYGFLILILASPILIRIDLIKNYIVYFYLIYITSTTSGLISQFARGIGEVKNFAINGVLTTATTIIFNIILLIVMDMGIEGYFLATILSNVISCVFLYFSVNLKHYITFKNSNTVVRKSMLSYSVPLIPNSISWWINNIFDRYVIIAFCGVAANGLYAVAYKLPTILTTISNIFMQAWQISAVKEHKKSDTSKFYSEVYNYYCTFVIIVCSILILFTKFICYFMFSDEFFVAWKYVPLLVLAVAFGGFSGFLGSIYVAEKKSFKNFLSTSTGALVNISLNLLLVPRFGALGAACATFISYLIVWLIRTVDTKKYIKIKINYLLMGINIALLVLQSWILITEIKFNFVYQIGIALLIVIINYKIEIELIKRIIPVFKRRLKK